MAQVDEKTTVGEPAEEQQKSIGLASRLLKCLGVCLVDCSKSLGVRNMWMMKWSSSRPSKLTVFFRYGYGKTFKCHFELEPPIDSSFPKFLAKVAAFEGPSTTANFTNWKENPFFGMSKEQMKIALDLAGDAEERGEGEEGEK